MKEGLKKGYKIKKRNYKEKKGRKPRSKKSYPPTTPESKDEAI